MESGKRGIQIVAANLQLCFRACLSSLERCRGRNPVDEAGESCGRADFTDFARLVFAVFQELRGPCWNGSNLGI